jgi:threonine dehydratase
MPESTPFNKIHNTEQLGAEVVLFGQTVDEAAEHARKLAAERRLVFIHPFDDPLIIAGQGTIGLELAMPRHRSTSWSCRSAAAASSPGSPRP